jgi:hypothetical protein
MQKFVWAVNCAAMAEQKEKRIILLQLNQNTHIASKQGAAELKLDNLNVLL